MCSLHSSGPAAVAVRTTGSLRLSSATALALLASLSGCGGSAPGQPPTPSAQVRIAVARTGTLSSIAMAYGTAVAAPGHNRIVVMPYEGVISDVAGHVGESIGADQPIVTITRTPAAAAQFAQAHSSQSFAEQDLARVLRLFADKLATNDQLASARKALADAQAQLNALNSVGAGLEQSVLRAPFAGVITNLTATSGDRPAVGSVIATIASPSDIIVQLGLEPDDAARLAPGAPVQLMLPLNGAPAVPSRLTSVGKALDGTSRLVNAVAPLPATQSAGITLGMTVLAKIELPARSGVLIARGAVLEDESGPFVYTVISGKAHRQSVQIGAETDESALITSGVADATQVIVAGNAALEDGIAVSDDAADSGPKSGAAPEPKP